MDALETMNNTLKQQIIEDKITQMINDDVNVFDGMTDEEIYNEVVEQINYDMECDN